MRDDSAGNFMLLTENQYINLYIADMQVVCQKKIA